MEAAAGSVGKEARGENKVREAGPWEEGRRGQKEKGKRKKAEHVHAQSACDGSRKSDNL